MVNLASQSPPTVQGPSSGDLWLRIVGTARAGQVVRLSAPKCTIGSADGCTLRLRAAGVRGVHCLILRGTRGTIARSYAAATRLNGQAFSDAPLVVGDRLKIGPIEMEVLASGDPDAHFENEASAMSAAASVANSVQDRRRHEQATVARGRARRLVETVRRLRTELAQVQDQSTAAAQNELDRQRLSDNHERMLMAFRDERRQWETSCEVAERELAERRRMLDAATSELEAARQAVANAKQESNQQTSRQSQKQKDTQARANQELQTAREAIEAVRDAWRQESAAARADLERERVEIAELRDQSARGERELEARQAALQAQFEARLAQIEQDQQVWLAAKQNDASRLTEGQTQLDADRAGLVAQVAAERAQIDDQRAALERQTADLEQRRIECEARLADAQALTAQLEAREKQVQAAQAEIEQATQALAAARCDQAAFASQQQGWQTEKLAAEKQMEVLTAELADREQQLTERAAAFARDEQARNELQGQQQAQADEQMKLVEERTAQLSQMQQSLEADRETFSTQRSQEEARLAERAESLEKMTAELQKRREEFANEQQALQASQQQTIQELRDRIVELESRPLPTAEQAEAPAGDGPKKGPGSAKRAKKLDAQKAQLDEAQREIELQSEKLSAERREAADRLAAEQSELERLREELAEEQAAFRAERATWHDEQSASARALDPSSDDESCVDDSSDEEPDHDSPAWRTETAQQPTGFDSGQAEDESPQSIRRNRRESTERPADEDESIDQYMAALLDRMRGGAQPAAAPAPAPKRNKRKSDAGTETAPHKPQPQHRDVTSPVVDMGGGTVEMTRRAPAEVTDLSAMRELANTHAKMAIDTHGKKRLVRSALITSTAAVGCMVAATLVLQFVSAEYTAVRTVTMIGYVGAIFWIFAAFKVVQQLVSEHISQQTELRDNIERAERRKTPDPAEPCESAEAAEVIDATEPAETAEQAKTV